MIKLRRETVLSALYIAGSGSTTEEVREKMLIDPGFRLTNRLYYAVESGHAVKVKDGHNHFTISAKGINLIKSMTYR